MMPVTVPSLLPVIPLIHRIPSPSILAPILPIMSPVMMMVMVLPLLPLFLRLHFRQRLHNLLPLLLQQELFHRIILIMFPLQLHQLHLLLNQLPLLLLLLSTRTTTLSFQSKIALQTSHPLLLFLAILPFIPRMIDFEHPTHHRRATKIINSEISRALVFVFEEAETFGFSGFAIAD